MHPLNRRFLLPVLAAALIFAITLGTRQSLALFISPLNSATGLGIVAISFAFAIAQLVWGLVQPFAGALADRYGTGRVLAGGALLVALGTALTPLAHTSALLVLAIGVLAATGAGAAGPSVLMAAVSRRIAPDKRGMATGLVNAGGSFGQFTIAPLAGALLAGIGWVGALETLALVTLLVLPAALWLRTPPAAPGERHVIEGTQLRAAIRVALRDPSYLLLCAGFFVCGFHVAFIATHLPGVVGSCGLPPQVAAWSLAVIGLFNIGGSFASGWAIGRWRMKSLLSLIYAARGLTIVAFLLAPKTATTFLVFSAAIGFTYLSTVPPTAGLVAKFYGPSVMATLFGLVMLSHQVGGFLGAWLGGKAYAATSSYNWMWYADIALAAFATLVHLPIRERPPRLAAAAA